MKRLSIVIPCYCEEKCIEETYRRINEEVVKEIRTDYEVEMIFVNDGSSDATLSILEKIASEDKNVKVVSFSQNFGHQAAVTAGLKEVTGDVCCIIDADLQDPPALIPEMLKYWEQGNAVVYGKRATRDNETMFKLLTAKAFYGILNGLSDVDIPKDTGDFRLVDRRLVDRMNASPEHNKFLRGLWASFGGSQYAFEYKRGGRYAGTTHYPLKKMLKLASDGIFGFSKKPITFIGISGVALLALAFIFMFAGVISAIAQGMAFVWFILGAMNFIGALVLFSLFFVGKYILLINDNTNGRAEYDVAKKINV